MKLIVRIILIGAITYFLSPFFTWWTGMLAAFLVCMIITPSTGLNAFIAGFLGVGLVWLGVSWVLDVANQSSFSSKIVELFPVDDSILLILVTGLVGGLSGGLAAITGANFKKLFAKEKKKGGYYN